MKIITKRTRSYPNGAVINFMKWDLCTERHMKGHWAYYWKKGQLCWIDNDDDISIDIVYFKNDNDSRTDAEINELLKKQVRLFRSFYQTAKKIIFKELDELERRYANLKNLKENEQSKELFWLMKGYHALLCEENNGCRYLDVESRMMQIMRMQRDLKDAGFNYKPIYKNRISGATP